MLRGDGRQLLARHGVCVALLEVLEGLAAAAAAALLLLAGAQALQQVLRGPHAARVFALIRRLNL